MRTPEQRKFAGLELFKSLIKDKCEWQGDVVSRNWSECLYCNEPQRALDVKQTLESYTEGEDYKIEGSIEDGYFAIWIY